MVIFRNFATHAVHFTGQFCRKRNESLGENKVSIMGAHFVFRIVSLYVQWFFFLYPTRIHYEGWRWIRTMPKIAQRDPQATVLQLLLVIWGARSLSPFIFYFIFLLKRRGYHLIFFSFVGVVHHPLRIPN